MTKGKLLPKIILFALPLVLSSVLQLFFTSCDLIVVGNFGGGPSSLGAIGATNAIINLIVHSAVGFSSALNIIVGNARGANDKEKADKAIHTSFIVALFLGVFIAVFGFFFAKDILVLTECDPLVLDQATVYLQVYFLGAPAILIYNFAAAAFRGYGDSLSPLLILVISGVLNAALNILFVVAFDMDVFGVALATVISQIASAVIGILILMKSKRMWINVHLNRIRWNPEELMEILKLGAMCATQSVFFNVTNVLIQSGINGFGAAAMAGSAAATTLDGYIYCAMNSIAVASMAVVSQNYGANDEKRAKKTLLYSSLLAVAVGVLLGGIAIALRYPLIAIFLKDTDPNINYDEAMAYAIERVLVISITYWLCGIMDSCNAYYRGLKYSLVPTLISFGGSVVIRLVFLFTLFKTPYFHTMTWLMMMYPISWIITIVLYLALLPHYTKKAFLKNSEINEAA